MSNLSAYKDTWSRYRQQVSAAIRERDKAFSKIEGYSGRRADEEREAIAQRFEEAVSTARGEAGSSFGRILKEMKAKAEEVGEVMRAPSEETLRTLQMLSLRTSITQAEAEAAAKSMRGDDAALATLQELCVGRGGVRIAAMNKSQRQQAFDALREFEDAAQMCLSWEGGTRGELMRERNAQQLAQVPESERVPIGAAIAADVDARSMSHDEFVRTIVGNTATVEGASLLE